jgi:hypothetical protein
VPRQCYEPIRRVLRHKNGPIVSAPGRKKLAHSVGLLKFKLMPWIELQEHGKLGSTEAARRETRRLSDGSWQRGPRGDCPRHTFDAETRCSVLRVVPGMMAITIHLQYT